MATRKEINELREDQAQKLQGLGKSWTPTHPRLIGAPPILLNEALSSWCWRIASHFGVTVKTVLSMWGVETLSHLMDSGVSFPDWGRVGTSTGTPLKEIESLRLCYPALLSSPEFSCLTHYKKSKIPIYRYCHECLSSDEIPYFRKEWRYSFLYVCPKHDCMLFDTCPTCRKPINLSRRKATKSNNPSSESLRFCNRCQSDLCTPRTVLTVSVMRHRLYMQQRILLLLLTKSQPNFFPKHWFGLRDPLRCAPYTHVDEPDFLISFPAATVTDFNPTKETCINAITVIARIRLSLRRELFTYAKEFGHTKFSLGETYATNK